MEKRLIIAGSIIGGAFILKKVIDLSVEIGFLSGMVYANKSIEKDFKNKRSKVGYHKYRDYTTSYGHYKSKYEQYHPERYIFETMDEAETVLSALTDNIEEYGVVTISDLNALIGISSYNDDDSHGWTDISNAYISYSADGYGLHMPKPKLLEEEEN
jgi:hypothetical protein